jgi:hypothetical protein
MKKLSDYCVHVNNSRERELAIKFFKLASHRPRNSESNTMGNYVGMGGRGYTDSHYKGSKPTVTVGPVPYDTEIVIPFSNIYLLSDTPSRQEAYLKVFCK